MIKIVSITTLFILLSFSAIAEYRVYQYFVRSKNNFIQDNPSYIVTSSLNPVAYVAYHGGASNIEVDLVRTWMCPGNTGHRKEYCQSPYKKLSDVLKATGTAANGGVNGNL